MMLFLVLVDTRLRQTKKKTIEKRYTTTLTTKEGKTAQIGSDDGDMVKVMSE